LIVLVSLPGPIGLGYGLYKQLLIGQPWGERPMSDTTLIAVASAVFVVDALLVGLFASARLVTLVRADGLDVRFAPIHRRFLRIDLGNVDDVAAVTYAPIRDYGGWGIRFGREGKAYNVWGNRGVRLTFSDGRKLLIGSQRADELVTAIERVRKPR